jgi:hypothetical protein
MRQWRAGVVTAVVGTMVGFGACQGGGQPADTDDPVRINPSAFPIPRGPGATIDGTFTADEWQGAASVSFSFQNQLGDSLRVDVWLQHDGDALEVAYVFQAPDSASVSPEIFIDTDFDRSPSLQADDYWFHLSGSDCTAVGAYDDYSGCVMRAWWASAPPPEDRLGGMVRTFEMRVPLQRLDLATGSELGLAFRMMHAVQVSGEWVVDTDFWPSAGSPDNPSTWRFAQLVP